MTIRCITRFKMTCLCVVEMRYEKRGINPTICILKGCSWLIKRSEARRCICYQSVFLSFGVIVMLLLVKDCLLNKRIKFMSSSLSKKYETQRMMLCNLTVFSQLSYWMIKLSLKNTSSLFSDAIKRNPC